MKYQASIKQILARRSKAEGDCIIWTGACTPYGVVRVGHRTFRVHRLAYEAEYGPIPDGMCVLHRCDNPRCIKVAHLFLGSHADNVRDAVSKGRTRNGGGTPYRHLTYTDAEYIRKLRADGQTVEQIAETMGSSMANVQAVCTGRTWKV